MLFSPHNIKIVDARDIFNIRTPYDYVSIDHKFILIKDRCYTINSLTDYLSEDFISVESKCYKCASVIDVKNIFYVSKDKFDIFSCDKCVNENFERPTCPICKEIIPEDRELTMPSCKHMFCKICLTNSLVHNPLCPCCGNEMDNKRKVKIDDVIDQILSS